VTDSSEKQLFPVTNAVQKVRELFLNTRFLLMAAGLVALIFIVIVLFTLPNNDVPQPLTESDIEQIAHSVVTEHTESQRDALNELTERVALLPQRMSGLADEVDLLQGQVADIEKDVAMLKSVDWTQALERANESWQAHYHALTERIGTVETQLKQPVKSKVRTSLPNTKTSAPSFHIASLEQWGDTHYVTLSVGGGLVLLREGETHQGWQFIGLDADSGDAVFAHGKQTRKVRVGR
jgi:hypothetical protein